MEEKQDMGKPSTPLMTREKMLVTEGGLGIFIFSAKNPGEAVIAPILKESHLDIGALGEMGHSIL